MFYPIWLLGIVFLRCMLKVRSKTLWLSYSFSSKYSCFPNPSICYQSFKKNYLIDLFFLCWKLKSRGLKKNVHENKIFLFNTFRLAFSLSSLFWYMYIIIISPFHLSTHYYGHGNVTSYFREQSFDFYGGGGHGNLKKKKKSLINDHEVEVSYSSFIGIHCLFLIQM